MNFFIPFNIIFSYETSPLIEAIKKGDIEIIKLLLSSPNLDINMKYILQSFFNKMKNIIFNSINIKAIELRFKSSTLIQFPVNIIYGILVSIIE